MGAIAVRTAGELRAGLTRIVAVTCLLLFVGFLVGDPSLGDAVSPGVPASSPAVFVSTPVSASTPSSSVWGGDGFVVHRVVAVSGRQVAESGPGDRSLHPSRTGGVSLTGGSGVALGGLLTPSPVATPRPEYLAHPGYRRTILRRVSRPPTRPD